MSDQKRDIAQIKAELDEILAWFEDGQADVATAVSKYEQGLNALSELESQLKTAKLKIEKLDKQFND